MEKEDREEGIQRKEEKKDLCAKRKKGRRGERKEKEERKKEKIEGNMKGKKDAKEENMKEEIELKWKNRRRQERGATNGERGDERRRNIRKEEKKRSVCKEKNKGKGKDIEEYEGKEGCKGREFEWRDWAEAKE
jgi:hypothetical protein